MNFNNIIKTSEDIPDPTPPLGPIKKRPDLQPPLNKENKSNTSPATDPAKKPIQSALSFASVKRMQQKMQSLAKDVISGTTDIAAKSKPNEYEDKSKEAFNDFIAENFIGELPENMRGVEWSKDPTITTQRGKQLGQTGIYELDVVMDTIKRIGREKSEFKPDGIWDWRTHNALKNILGFSHALLQLEGELRIENNIYTKQDLDNFKNLLNVKFENNRPVFLSDKDKQDRAEKITAILSKILELYSSFRIKVLEKQDYKNSILGRKPFITHSNEDSNKDTLTAKEEETSKLDNVYLKGLQYRSPKDIGANFQRNFIPLNALTSKDNYMKYMSSIGIKDPNMAFNIFKIIKKQIDEMKLNPEELEQEPILRSRV